MYTSEFIQFMGNGPMVNNQLSNLYTIRLSDEGIVDFKKFVALQGEKNILILPDEKNWVTKKENGFRNYTYITIALIADLEKISELIKIIHRYY